jgi:hypothetical protein
VEGFEVAEATYRAAVAPPSSQSMFRREPPWRDFWIFEIAHAPPYDHYQGSLVSAAFSAARMKPFKSPSDVSSKSRSLMSARMASY